MRTYALRCPICQHRFEHQAAAKDRDAIACPNCACTRVETDYQAQTLCVRVKAGTGPTADDRAKHRRLTQEAKEQWSPRTSLAHYFPTRDISRARRELGNECGSMIADDGTVRYRTLKDERRFGRAMEKLQARGIEKDNAKNAKARERVKRGEPAFGHDGRTIGIKHRVASIPAKVRARAKLT